MRSPASKFTPDTKFILDTVHGGEAKIDFADLRPEPLAMVFANGLKAAASIGGPVGARTTVAQYCNAIRKFFEYLTKSAAYISTASDLRAWHIDEFESWLEGNGLRPIHRHKILSKPINCLRSFSAESPDALDPG